MNQEQKNNYSKIINFLKEQELSVPIFNSLSFEPLKNSANIYQDYNEHGQSYGSILSYFQPSLETIEMSKIGGIDFDEGNLLEVMSSIYRNEEIINNLGKFDMAKFNNSLKSGSSNYELIELNDKYYVNGDGNHRTLLMIFQYYMTLTSLIQNKCSYEAISRFKKEAVFNAPVVHLEHDPKLIYNAENLYNKISKIGGFEFDYIKNNTSKKTNGKNFFLKYNKENDKYFVYYNGITRDNLNPAQALDFLEQLNNLDLNNNILLSNNVYFLHNKYIGVKNVPSNKIYDIDKAITNLNLEDMNIDYFIDFDFKTKKAKLNISSKDYGNNTKASLDTINNFIEKNNHIFSLNKKKPDEDGLFTFFNFLNEMEFENISMDKAKEIINTVHSLDKTIRNEPIKKSNR